MTQDNIPTVPAPTTETGYTFTLMLAVSTALVWSDLPKEQVLERLHTNLAEVYGNDYQVKDFNEATQEDLDAYEADMAEAAADPNRVLN